MIMAWFGKEKSGSLEDFRETLKDVLEEITVLEINTMIVDKVFTDKFDVEDFFNEIMINIPIKPTEQPSNAQDCLVKEKSENEKRNERKEKSYAKLREKISEFDIKFKIVKCKTGNCKVVKCETGKCETGICETSKCEPVKSETAKSKTGKSEPAKSETGKCKLVKDEMDKCETDKCLFKLDNPDAQMTRYFRKLWETEQSFINDDLVWAQTKLTLDGDLTNRFVKELFQLNSTSNVKSSDVKTAIDPKMAGLILNLHRQSVINGQNQWSGLINTCVNLVKSLIPFRK